MSEKKLTETDAEKPNSSANDGRSEVMEDPTDGDEGQEEAGEARGLFWAATITICWIGAALCLLSAYGFPAKVNEWGDFAAGASAPLAFLWLVIAVAIQAKELKAQRKELKLTRKEFNGQRRVMAEQMKYVQQQTAVLAETRLASKNEAIYQNAVKALASILQLYPYAWRLGKDGEPHDASEGDDIDYGTLTDRGMIIARTAQELRKTRGWERAGPLKLGYPEDFKRVRNAIENCIAEFTEGEGLDTSRVRALELQELLGLSEKIRLRTSE